MRKVTFSLIAGIHKGQETAEEKLKAGLEYVEKLKREDVVVSVEIEEGKEIVIMLQ